MRGPEQAVSATGLGAAPSGRRSGMRLHLHSDSFVGVPVSRDDWVVEHLLCNRAGC
jgi:hypothetical protein